MTHFQTALPQATFGPEAGTESVRLRNKANTLPMKLTKRDQDMLDGHKGPAAKMAMSILVRMAKIWDAQELMDISQAHIDSTIYIGRAGLEFATAT